MENHMRFILMLILACSIIVSSPFATAATQDPQARVNQVINAAGGEVKLLELFRFSERILITATEAPPVTEGEKGNRTSVVQVGGNWWIGTAKRDKDKVRVLCWAWSLRILLDSNSKIQSIPDIEVAGRPTFGLRVTGSVKEPIDLYFDKELNRLAAIDYDDTRHIFTEWKKTDDGKLYPSHVVGFRFENREDGRLKDKQWYQTDILELTPLSKLPDELKQ